MPAPALALALSLASAGAGTGAAGCRRDPAPSPAPAESVQASEPRAPVDQLLPGEIAAGSEEAFGLPIPRSMLVSARFPDAVFANGDLSPEQVANYVRRRVLAERVETGPAKTVFLRATMKDAPQRTLRIEVVSRGSTTALVVRDETRPPAKPGLTEEERWRELGLTPQGAPLDPTQLE